jgi:hypothetical protein
MPRIEVLAHSGTDKGIHTHLGKFGDELFAAKHREDLLIHFQAVRRHHLASRYIRLIGEGIEHGPEARINLGCRRALFGLLPWHWQFLVAVAASATVKIDAFSS